MLAFNSTKVKNQYGGGRGIRTPAGFDTPVGFQDRSLQPDLGIPPYRQELIYHIILFEVNIFSKKISICDFGMIFAYKKAAIDGCSRLLTKG